MPWSEAVVPLQSQVQQAWSCNGWADSLSSPVRAFEIDEINLEVLNITDAVTFLDARNDFLYFLQGGNNFLT